MSVAREFPIAAAQGLWRPQSIYLNTASFGMPPDPAWDALQAALEDWRGGRTSWEDWTNTTTVGRDAFARLVGADPAGVVVGATVSGLVSLVAAAVPDGARVLVPEGDFASLAFPFMAQTGRGVEVSFAPLETFAEAVGERTPDVVAFGAVQSRNGYVAALDEIEAAARRCGALTVVDATQAVGWLPFDATRFDAVACAAYKWLMCPRGTAFLVVAEALAGRMTPSQAGWFSSADPFTDQFAPPLSLAQDARRFDTSPAWFSWVGTVPALELVERIGIDAIHDHDVRLANRFRAGLGMEPSNSAIVSADVPDAEARLREAGIMAASRAGRLRVSFHIYNTDADADAAIAALT